MDEMGIEKIDDVAREKVLGQLFEGKVSPEKMSEMVNTELAYARKADKDIVTKAYNDADKIGHFTDQANLDELKDQVFSSIKNVKSIDGQEIRSSGVKAYEDMFLAMDRADLNAEGLEQMRRDLQKMANGKHKDDKHLFTPIIDSIEAKQTELFAKDGITDNPYLPAREADIGFKAKWEGTRKGLAETKTGKKLKAVMDAPSKTQAGIDLLGQGNYLKNLENKWYIVSCRIM
jgi:hypothetical protein